MKNMFLTLFRLFAKRRILALLFLFGPFASQGAARANQESRLNQAIAFEMFEAIKSEDSKTYEGLFYDLALNLKASGDLKRLLLSAKDERGNNIFHLMAGVSPESPAGLFFQNEIMNLLLFLTLRNFPPQLNISLGGMAYSEMPKALQREKGSMSIDSVVKKFLDAKNKEGQTPELIARNSQNPITAKNFHRFSKILNKVVTKVSPPFTGLITGPTLCSIPAACVSGLSYATDITSSFWLPFSLLIGLGAIAAPPIIGHAYRQECRQAIIKFAGRRSQ